MNSGLSAGLTYHLTRRIGCTGLLSHSQLVKEGKSLLPREEWESSWLTYLAYRCIGRGLAWTQIMKCIVRILQEFDRFELAEGMTDYDMDLIERGALAKPRSTQMWVNTYAKAI